MHAQKDIRKWLTGFVLLICFSAGVFSFCYFDGAQLLCKIAAQSHLEENQELTVIKIENSAIAPNDKEVWYHGALYDVYSMVTVGDSTIVTVWHDEGEEQIQHQITSIFETSQQYLPGFQNHYITTYHPFIPEGKIMPQPVQLDLTGYSKLVASVLYFGQAKQHLPSRYIDDVLKPPPDQLG